MLAQLLLLFLAHFANAATVISNNSSSTVKLLGLSTSVLPILKKPLNSNFKVSYLEFSDSKGVCFNTNDTRAIWIPYICSLVPSTILSKSACSSLSYETIIDNLELQAVINSNSSTYTASLNALFDLSNTAFFISNYYNYDKGLLRTCSFSPQPRLISYGDVINNYQALSTTTSILFLSIKEADIDSDTTFPAYIMLPKACSIAGIANGCKCLKFSKCANVKPFKSSIEIQVEGSMLAKKNFATPACSASAISAITSC